MSFQRNRFGIEQEIIEISEKDLADKVIVREQFVKIHRSTKDKLHQIKATQFYTNFLKLISSVMRASISKVEFNV